MIAYAQLGVRPMLHGDLWGILHSTCGKALTFDLDWQLSLTAQAAAFGGEPKRWDEIWATGRKHIQFWNLEGATALQPLLEGPVSGLANTSLTYGMKMRSCWLYGDAITYRLDWGDGSSGTYSDPPQSSTTAAHYWTQAGTKVLQLMTVQDAHGRVLNAGGASLNLQIDSNGAPQAPPPPGPENYRRVTIAGTLALKDDEVFGEERDSLGIYEVVELSPDTRSVTLPTISFCVGDEVRAEVKITVTRRDDNRVAASASGKLFEGDDCNSDDLEAVGSVDTVVEREASSPLSLSLVSAEEGHDSATLSLNVTNAQR